MTLTAKIYNMKTFKYRKAIKIIYWGYEFDSLLELKFAISIQEDYEFLRSHISIHYNPRTKIPTEYIREGIKRYTPDFLIRHKITNEAFWVEVKPRAFENQTQLLQRKEVAENYIQWKGYDWKYIVIYDDEIILSQKEEKQLDECRKLIGTSAAKLRMQDLNNQFDRSSPSLFKGSADSKQVQFVMLGKDFSISKNKFQHSQ